MRQRGTPYAGISGAGLKPFISGVGDAYVEQQQATLRDRVLKEWKAERKDQLQKYAKGVSSLKRVRDEINEWIEFKSPMKHERVGSEAEFNAAMAKYTVEFDNRAAIVNDMMKGLVEDYRSRMMKAGLTTSIGYNFYDLRGPAYLIYPVNTPLRNELPRWGKVNAGVGTAANWKYTYLSPGTSYAGAQEGERVATATPGENNAVATYAELGVERSVTFTAEFAGEGYTDNVADEHIRGAHELWLQEESIIIGGNPGTGAGLNGFALGTANTPSTAAYAHATIPAGAPSDGGSGFVGSTHVSVYVVELTMLGYPNNAQFGYQAAPTITSGLVPSYTRTNADGTTNTIKGGMGAISAASNVTTVTTDFVLAQVTPKAGAFAWAWFINLTDATTPSKANSYLTVITTVPYLYIGGGTPGTYPATSTGLTTDNSYEVLDFAGIFAWAVNNGTFINMSNLNATSPITGATNTGLLNPGMAQGQNAVPAVAEIEYDLEAQWNVFQTVADEIYCSADVKRNIQAALFTNTSGVPAYRFDVSRDAQGNILGGFTVSGYKSLYSMKDTGSEELPIKIHPMLPPGTMLYRKNENPYPSSRIPGVSGMFVQRDYYGIEWPITTRAWTFGTYCHEVYGDYIPGLLTVRTGITGVNT
jgi:hypothetical protein